MKRPPVIFFAGDRRLAIPHPAYLAIQVMLIAASLVSIVNTVLPGLLGKPPPFPLPETVQTIADVLACITAILVQLALIVFLLGVFEEWRAASRFTDFSRLIPLAELPAARLLVAPNLSDRQRAALMSALLSLAAHESISSIIAPASDSDMGDDSVDRLFITTTATAKDFRKIVRRLKCDEVSKVPDRIARRITGKASFGDGTLWQVAWD